LEARRLGGYRRSRDTPQCDRGHAFAAAVEKLTGAQRNLHVLVGRCLCEAYGDRAGTASRQATYLVPVGPHGVRVSTCAVGENDALVELYTWLGDGVDLTPSVTRYLLEKNAFLRFGSLGIDADGGVLLADSLLAEHVNAVELARHVELLGATADEVERELAELYV
jgi:type III secretion system-like peptide-binding chaperone